MCLSMPKIPQTAAIDPNAAANAAQQDEMQRRRSAQGYGSTIYGGAGTQQPSLARKMLYGQ